MDFVAIFSLVAKGLVIVENLIQAEKDAEPAIKALISLTTNAKNKVVTVEEYTATEALLDQLIADFNLEMPEG